jgi:hypothetical protein
MIRSTMAPMSSRVEMMICSAIFSGSSSLKKSFGVPILAIPLSTARLPIFAAREGTMPCQPIPPIISPGICWSLRGSSSASCSSQRTRQPLKWTG